MIKCGHCESYHVTTTDVRDCSLGHIVHKCVEPRIAHPCGWLMNRGMDEDGRDIILPCGADEYVTDRGQKCVVGHDNVRLEIADREGWAYVTADEAAGFAKNTLRTPVLMDGSAWRG